jgi:hypothetical protein
MEQPSSIPLSKHFREAVPEPMAPRVQARFSKLYAAHELPANPKLRWHLRDYILPGLALYQLWREDGDSPETALAKVDQAFERLAARSRNRMQLLGRLPFVYPLLRILIKPAMGQYPADGWQLEWKENSTQAIRFDMKRCFYHEVLSRQGAPELTAAFCRIDDLVYGDMSPRLAWRRTQTIGRGAAYCDFCFARR